MDDCCNAFEELAKISDLPFTRPIRFDRGTLDLKVGYWAIQLAKLTKSGAISRRSPGVVTLVFCPFCGTRLIPEDGT